MKPNAILINTARGPIVDQVALYKALKEKRIFAAALDVFEKEPIDMNDPLIKLDNVVLLPHLGSASLKTREVSVQTIILIAYRCCSKNIVQRRWR